MYTKNFINHNDFANWYILKRMEHGELISTSTAAKLLGVKMPYIYQLWKEEKLNRVTYHDESRKKPLTYYYMREIEVMISAKEQIYNAKNDPNREVVDLSNYPYPEVYDWQKNWSPQTGLDLEAFLNKKFQQWEKDNPEKAKIFKNKPKEKINLMTILQA